MEKVTIRINPANPSPDELREYFAEVFASLDEHPRTLIANIHTANDANAKFSISIAKGEPVFELEGCPPAHGYFRGRWLAQHPSPLVFHRDPIRLVFAPTTGNRVIVRQPSFFERMFG